jgi:glycosyltransferase involved in cell wall biosynthesis
MSPKISILMPSFNQVRFLEHAIDSVLTQRGAQKELIVIDGGSTDGSRLVLERYSRHLAYWCSEPDGGQSAALNKALAHVTGDIIGWQNSDDLYLPGAFQQALDAIHSQLTADFVFGNIHIVDQSGAKTAELRFTRFQPSTMVYEGTAICNQAAFWKRSIHQRIGGFDANLRFCMDYEFFLRAAMMGCTFRHVRSFWGAFRTHEAAKSTNEVSVGVREHREIVNRWRPQLAANSWRSRLGRTWSRSRRALGYIVQGDLAYVCKGAIKCR